MNPIFLKNDSYFDEPCRVVTNETLDRWKKHTHNEIPALEGDLYMWSIKSIIFKLFIENYLTNSNYHVRSFGCKYGRSRCVCGEHESDSQQFKFQRARARNEQSFRRIGQTLDAPSQNGQGTEATGVVKIREVR